MHGLVNKAIETFLIDTCGPAAWQEIARRSGVFQRIGPDGFEPMQVYDDAITRAVVQVGAAVLRRPVDMLLEDFGTSLICDPRNEPLRRLLRFGGVSFTDFLFSLEDLRGRSQLALPELDLPELTLDEGGAGQFILSCETHLAGLGHVLVGILRALADDYGALAVLEYRDPQPIAPAGAGAPPLYHERIAITVHDPAFHAGRRFDLAAQTR